MRPSAVKPALTVPAGWPERLNGAVKPMCDIASSPSPHGMGHSAGKAAIGATGEMTRSKASVAATVACWIARIAV